jgi:hypothetical protein
MLLLPQRLGYSLVPPPPPLPAPLIPRSIAPTHPLLTDHQAQSFLRLQMLRQLKTTLECQESLNYNGSRTKRMQLSGGEMLWSSCSKTKNVFVANALAHKLLQRMFIDYSNRLE